MKTYAENVLSQIFENKREEVVAAKRELPLGLLREQAANAAAPRGFQNALETSSRPVALIAEVKKASPSQGVIRSDFDAVEIAHTYQHVGASAVSVLTDAKYFSGSPEDLRAVRAAVELPILRKDFIEDPYQVYEARAWGADAVLLIVAGLDQPRLVDLQDTIRGLGMDALVEVHDEEELERALNAGATMIGVNNRSLKDLSTDLATGEKLLSRAGQVVAIAESAIKSHEDVERMRRAGARAVLVGTTFCASEDVATKVRQVMGWE